MLIKTTVQPIVVTTIKNKTNKQKTRTTSFSEDVETLELLYSVGGNQKWYNHFGKHYENFFKN